MNHSVHPDDFVFRERWYTQSGEGSEQRRLILTGEYEYLCFTRSHMRWSPEDEFTEMYGSIGTDWTRGEDRYFSSRRVDR